MEVNRIIIACRTLEKELLRSMQACGCADPIIWLEAGAHNVPQKRLESIRQALRECAGCDTVLLAMTFCGNSLVGLESGEHNLVLPRFDDCIPVLLGGRRKKPDAYYLSEGWLQGQDHILSEYERTAQKYGNARADRIFASMLRHYHQLIWLSDAPSPAAPQHVRQFAERFGLRLSCESTDSAILDKLIRGQWDEYFVLIPPHRQITLEMRKAGEHHA